MKGNSMTKVIVSWLLLGIVLNVFPYHLDWIKAIGTPLNDYIMGTAYDSVNDRVYVAGVFDTIVQPHDTVGMPFLDAYSESGAFIWRAKITGSDGSDILSNGDCIGELNKIVVDREGFVYSCGWCCNTILVDSIVLPKDSGQPCVKDFSGDMFIAKYNALGHVLWAKRFQGQYSSGANDLVVLSDGVYICGSSSGSISLNSVKLGDNDWPAFICKLLPSGELSWFKYFIGYNRGILLNPQSDSMQLILSFGNGAIFNGQSLLNNGETGVIISSLSKNGDISIGSIYHNTDVFFSAKTLDQNGNMYIAGTYENSTTFGDYILQKQSDQNFFIAKVTPTGSISWLNTQSYCKWDAIGMSVGHLDILWNNTDRLFLTGSFSGTLAFNSDTLRVDTTLVPTRYNRFDGFIFSFSNTGHANWCQQIAGPKIDCINGLCQKDRSTIYLAGEFDSITTFMQNQITAKGKNDAFLCRVSIDTGLFTNNRFDRELQSTAKKFKYFIGIITNKNLSNVYEYYDFLGKRISVTGNRKDLLGKLAVIHKK